jgi:hypothetical protein
MKVILVETEQLCGHFKDHIGNEQEFDGLFDPLGIPNKVPREVAGNEDKGRHMEAIDPNIELFPSDQTMS